MFQRLYVLSFFNLLYRHIRSKVRGNREKTLILLDIVGAYITKQKHLDVSQPVRRGIWHFCRGVIIFGGSIFERQLCKDAGDIPLPHFEGFMIC